MPKVVYITGAGEGPEPRKLGAPFGYTVTPNEPFEVLDPEQVELLKFHFGARIKDFVEPAPVPVKVDPPKVPDAPQESSGGAR